MLGLKLIEDKKAKTYENVRNIILEYIRTHEVDGNDDIITVLFHIIDEAEKDIKEFNTYVYDDKRWVQ
jgi:hypothetical protein